MTPAILAILAIIAVIGTGIAVHRRMRDAQTYIAWHTMFGPAAVFTVVDDDGSAVRLLFVGGGFQSATYIDDDRCYDLIFSYDKLYDRMFETDLDIGRVLMLGGGGYAYPKHFVATQPEASIDVVEIDPVVTSLAERFFFLDRLIEEFEALDSGRLGLICDDGRAYLDQAAELARTQGPLYDVVLNDAFAGSKPVATLATVEAALSARDCLVPGGLYMTNVVSALEGRGSEVAGAIAATLACVFEHVHMIPCAAGDGLWDRDNVMVVATDGDWEFSGTYAPTTGPAGGVVLRDDEQPDRVLKHLSKQ